MAGRGRCSPRASPAAYARGDADVDESGLRFGGMLETPAYGSFTLDAILRHSSDDAVEGLRQPVHAGTAQPADEWRWFVDNALGVTDAASDLARRQYRFYVPTIPMNGGRHCLENGSPAGSPRR